MSIDAIKQDLKDMYTDLAKCTAQAKELFNDAEAKDVELDAVEDYIAYLDKAIRGAEMDLQEATGTREAFLHAIDEINKQVGAGLSVDQAEYLLDESEHLTKMLDTTDQQNGGAEDDWLELQELHEQQEDDRLYRKANMSGGAQRSGMAGAQFMLLALLTTLSFLN